MRATKRPPQHLVGRNVGTIRVTVYAAKQRGAPRWADVQAGRVDWIAPDEALPEHPSVIWRKQLPQGRSSLPGEQYPFGARVHCARHGRRRRAAFPRVTGGDVTPLTEPLDDAETVPWVLAGRRHSLAKHLAPEAAKERSVSRSSPSSG